MGRMGHVSMRAALIYQHRTFERDRAIAEALDAMLRRGVWMSPSTGSGRTLGTFEHAGRKCGDVRLDGPRVTLTMTRRDTVERVTRIELA